MKRVNLACYGLLFIIIKKVVIVNVGLYLINIHEGIALPDQIGGMGGLDFQMNLCIIVKQKEEDGTLFCNFGIGD